MSPALWFLAGLVVGQAALAIALMLLHGGADSTEELP